jgi:ABC-type transport system involved in Fe-S cluster assembly fused permease/ATPase subunit
MSAAQAVGDRPAIRVLPPLLKAAWQCRGRVIAATLLLLVAKAATVAVPLSLKLIVDALGAAGPAMALPIVLLTGYAALRFAGTLFNELRDVVFNRVTQRTVAEYATMAFEHVLVLDAAFHARRRTGALLRDIDRGTAGIAFLMGVGLFTLVPTLVEIGFVMFILERKYNDWFAVIILATFFVYTGYTLKMTGRRETIQRRVNALDTSAKAQLADSLLNHDSVKFFANEAHERRRFVDIMKVWIGEAVRNQKSLFVLHVGQSAIIAVGVAAVMLFAGAGVIHGFMTVGDLILVNAYVIQICLPLNTLGFIYREARDARTNAERLFELLGEPPQIVDAPGARPLVIGRAGITFDHVSFAYEHARPALYDMTFVVEPGQTIGVVGGSGSGKSTLARLLLRMYDPQQGHILVDGQDLRTVTLASLRNAIGVVPQDTTLFNETIAYNIGYGKIGATHDEIVAAAKAAQIHALVESLPLGYDTLVGERGVMLSGGERQRVAIARAVIKDPPILVFDEATSALDSKSEQAIQHEVERVARDRTALIIAHRLSTVAGADQILVLERGRLVERGTHVRLLLKGGVYAHLWRLQQLERKSTDVPDAVRRKSSRAAR